MKKLVFASAALFFLFAATNAEAEILKGAAADSFIAKYFPHADIPGPVEGPFVYIDKWGKHRRGHANCNVPAMGARSDGEVSRCSVAR
jgi:hypothetical protein